MNHLKLQVLRFKSLLSQSAYKTWLSDQPTSRLLRQTGVICRTHYVIPIRLCDAIPDNSIICKFVCDLSFFFFVHEVEVSVFLTIVLVITLQERIIIQILKLKTSYKYEIHEYETCL